jgi:hypothetical protein
MKVAYVAGPYRDPRGPYYIGRNIEVAREIAIALWNMGYAVVCPHTNTAFMDGAAPDSVWLNGDLEILRRCDIIVMVPGWEKSTGAKGELLCAKDASLSVYYWADPMDRALLECIAREER